MREPGVTEGPAPFLIVGAGLSGAVLARCLAEAGFPCAVFEERSHVGGNCHTERDPATGILLHRHGPHTLHSDDAGVWDFVGRFAAIHPYRHLKRAVAGGEAYPSPINLQTLNQFFRKALGPEEAKALVAAEAAPFALGRPPADFEEAGLAALGRRLYDAFYRGYTIKQWGMAPNLVPASIFGRVPVRFEYDDNYFHHGRQGQPVEGYTAMIGRMLDHPLISVSLRRPFLEESRAGYRHVFYSGPIDRYFGWRHGRLPYRTLRFEDVRGKGARQGCAVINYCDEQVPYTRSTEHKFLSGWERHEETIVSYEYSADCGIEDAPYYPVHTASARAILERYWDAARATPHLSFIGRLGTFRYIDMHVAIREAMDAASATIGAIRAGAPLPAFFVDR